MKDKKKVINNSNRKPRKELPLWLNIILLLLFLVIYFIFNICVGLLISELINKNFDEIIGYAFWALVSGFIYLALLLILMRNSDSENVQPLKWYLNNFYIALIANLIVTSVVVLINGIENNIDINYFVAFGMFQITGIISTPKIVSFVKNDTKNWENILYSNGNLHVNKNSKDFYEVHAPVEFEKKLLRAVIIDQFLNIVVVIAVIVFIVFICIHYMVKGHHYTNNLFYNLLVIRFKRSFGIIFFLSVFFVIFIIPIMMFYISNAIKKIRVILKHEYIVYHAIVSSVKSNKIDINKDGIHYSYKYCNCVGIKSWKVKDTESILVFIPDDVFLFPVNEKYRV